MAVLLQRIRQVASVAGSERLAAVDELFMKRADIVRPLLEASEPRRVAFALAEIMDCFGIESMDHTNRLIARMRLLGDALGLDDRERQAAELGCLIHDVGKLGVAGEILFSPLTLSPSELDSIRMHSSLGHAIVFGVAGMREAASLVLSHHEYYDGSGYHGWGASETPRTARMFSVVDSYDAMVRHDRPFRMAVDHRRAFAELHVLSGSKYDPDIIAALAGIERDWLAVGSRQLDLAGAVAESDMMNTA